MTLTPLEQATGSLFGFVDDPRLRPLRGISARQALEAVIETALRRPPCAVSFSGGRDSSAVLAVATDIARRTGLPLPIPVTLSFPDCPSSNEDEWQELVVRHLGLPDWQRLAFHDELDLIGPVAAPVLARIGLQWPFNAYFHLPIFDVAAGGSVLTGAGGDEVFSSALSWHRENLVLTGRARIKPLDPVRIAVSLGPPALRRIFLGLRHRGPDRFTPAWLRAPALDAVRRLRLQAAGRESLSFRHSIAAAWWARRSRMVGMASLQSLADERDVICSSPLASESFLGALIAQRRWRMFADRTEATRWLVGDLLPQKLTARATKAYFDVAFFNRHSRAFAVGWDGTGLDEDYVDVDALRAIWTDTSRPPDARTYTLLQSAWLASVRTSDPPPSPLTP